MLSVVEVDVERANLIEKIIKMLCDVKAFPFFFDIVVSIQSTIVNNVEKINDPESKERLRKSIASLIVHLPDSESKTLFTQTLNSL